MWLTGCAVGPNYKHPPTAVVPPAFKETPPNWQAAQPKDQFAKGQWWAVYDDPLLSELEAKVNVSNQSLKASLAQYVQSRALVRYNRASLYPTVTANPQGSRNRQSQDRALASVLSVTNYSDITLPVDVSWEPDVFGRLRRTVEQARANAQVSAADTESLSLSLHAELASDYFMLRTLDAEERLLRDTVTAYEQTLQLTQQRYQGGVASAVDVAQAETQLQSTRAQAVDVQVTRSQFEHAIAVLVGQPPATFSIPFSPWNAAPPPTPPGLASDLLERRPDIAAAERGVAAATAGLGIARATYFPTFSITGSGGFESDSITNLISGPAGFYSILGSSLVTLFDVGRRRAVNEQAQAIYDQTAANYRQTILTAYQEVEDDLVALRILEGEAQTQQAAVAAAQQSLQLSNNRYRGGVVSYLEVITAQTTALTNERAAVDILRRRMTASVDLIKALGGGWSPSNLPSGNPGSDVSLSSGQ
nr:efflux transporter outer membrane subunit [Terriglobales bacterium]